ncbi:Cupin 2 conserved barrel domain protein [Candidatus Filomicrobium marinum]|uniref:Cupin 2 conserved barrel domain protein n=1 Tax=Candidatus Filomicrobium marinum TaxID=1608628 RepID=A0A0D6JJT4_9HYPH|nr:cupin domain-containing protein [Candidatus Filomicrobium marinum]CFX56373.1 Cupin 2 conserved barrel domain protein [Candidatus Filomicrobium marinum]CPR22233.1 Cupin 2 conserved barrel domain protein [Candidatus Filomicrobium marinum]
MSVTSRNRGCRLRRSAHFVAGVAAGIGLTLLVGAFMGAGIADARKSLQPSVDTLISISETILGEPISYPTGTAKVTAAVITVPVGASTGWHSHGVPLFAYILEGELTVDYGENGVRTYRSGIGFMEAIDIAHDGRNGGDSDVRILAVYMGAEGKALSRKAGPPSQ